MFRSPVKRNRSPSTHADEDFPACVTPRDQPTRPVSPRAPLRRQRHFVSARRRRLRATSEPLPPLPPLAPLRPPPPRTDGREASPDTPSPRRRRIEIVPYAVHPRTIHYAPSLSGIETAGIVHGLLIQPGPVDEDMLRRFEAHFKAIHDIGLVSYASTLLYSMPFTAKALARMVPIGHAFHLFDRLDFKQLLDAARAMGHLGLVRVLHSETCDQDEKEAADFLGTLITQLIEADQHQLAADIATRINHALHARAADERLDILRIRIVLARYLALRCDWAEAINLLHDIGIPAEGRMDAEIAFADALLHHADDDTPLALMSPMLHLFRGLPPFFSAFNAAAGQIDSNIARVVLQEATRTKAFMTTPFYANLDRAVLTSDLVCDE